MNVNCHIYQVQAHIYCLIGSYDILLILFYIYVADSYFYGLIFDSISSYLNNTDS